MEAKQVFNEELQKLTVDGLKNMGVWVEGAKDFALEQAPLFAQEYVKWYAVDHINTAISLGVVVAIFIWGFLKASRWLKKCDMDEYFEKTLTAILAILCFVVNTILTVIAVNNLGSAAKAYISPRVVIVDGIKEILEGGK